MASQHRLASFWRQTNIKISPDLATRLQTNIKISLDFSTTISANLIDLGNLHQEKKLLHWFGVHTRNAWNVFYPKSYHVSLRMVVDCTNRETEESHHIVCLWRHLICLGCVLVITLDTIFSFIMLHRKNPLSSEAHMHVKHMLEFRWISL